MDNGFYQEKLILAARPPILKKNMTMKYRIKEIEYADGTKEFWTQEIRAYKLNSSSRVRETEVFCILMTLPLSIWFFMFKIFFLNKTEHSSIIDAQKEIDDLLLAEAKKLEAERLRILRNKIVKTKLTKYP